MKKQHLLKSMLLLCALVVGSSNLWATTGEHTETYVFTNTAPSGWTSTGTTGGTASYEKIISGEYVWADISTLVSDGEVLSSTLEVNVSAGTFGTWNGDKQVTVTVDLLNSSDVVLSTANYTKTSLTKSETAWIGDDYPISVSLPANPSAIAKVRVTFTIPDDADVLRFKNLKVHYSTATASTDPAIVALSDKNIAADATSGEIAYTITNPVSETHLTASITAGGTWLSNATVDEANSKVTFKATANTGAKRTGTIHLAYGADLATKDITVTQAGLYSITYATEQTGGTLVIKNGDDVVASGTKFPVGTTLTITATPDETHAYRNWQYNKGSGWSTKTSNFDYTIDDNNVEFRATFDATYPVNYNVNGQVSTTRYKEGADIDLSAPATEFGGFEFVGWAESTVDGVVVDKPALVTEATMGTSEKTYYAVYLRGVLKATFNASDVSNLTNSSLTWTEKATDIELTLSAGQRYTSGTPYTFTVTKGTTNYFRITVPSGCYLTKIVTTISGADYKINSVTEGSLNTSGTTQTITFTGEITSVDCKATSNYQIRATSIVVDAILKSIAGYCTSLTEAISTASGKTYATYVTDNALDFSSVSSYIKAYVAANTATSGTITFTGKDAVPANTPLLIKTTSAGATVNVPVIASAASAGTNYLVAGTGTSIDYDDEDGYYYYILSSGSFQWANNSKVATKKAYLRLPNGVGANQLTINFDDNEAGDVTGIATVSSKKQNNGEYFNLNGQRVDASHKGIVIVNGKKFFNK